KDAEKAFRCGADKINVGSLAVKNKELFLQWLDTFGADKVILSADCRNRKVAAQGWLETSEIDIIDFIQTYENHGLRQAVCTDIGRDGMLEGPAINLYKQILSETDVTLIASGGVSSINDLKQL